MKKIFLALLAFSMLLAPVFALPDYRVEVVNIWNSTDRAIFQINSISMNESSNATTYTYISAPVRLLHPIYHHDGIGGTVSNYVSVSCLPGQEVTLNASVDYFNRVRESDENNNAATGHGRCLNETYMPDLIVSSIEFPIT